MIGLIRFSVIAYSMWLAGSERSVDKVDSVAQNAIADVGISQCAMDNPLIIDPLPTSSWQSISQSSSMMSDATPVSARLTASSDTKETEQVELMDPYSVSYQECRKRESSKDFDSRSETDKACPTKEKRRVERDLEYRGNPRQVDESLCRIAAPYIDNHWWRGKRLKWLHNPSDGHNEIYLQDSVVIKKAAPSFLVRNIDPRKKQGKFENARNICEKYGYQLEIPTSCIYKEYSVEKRLPISSREAAAFAYYQNPSLFTERVKDFTAFLMRVEMSDLLSIAPNQARYDNVVPYLKHTKSGDVAAIALIDLDHLAMGLDPLDPWNRAISPVGICMTAIAFFPYHYNEILEVAKQFFPDIEKYRMELDGYKAVLDEQGGSST